MDSNTILAVMGTLAIFGGIVLSLFAIQHDGK